MAITGAAASVATTAAGPEAVSEPAVIVLEKVVAKSVAIATGAPVAIEVASVHWLLTLAG